MLDIFKIVFGDGGSASSFLGGNWWLVGLFLMFIFILYFYSKGVSMEGLILTLFAGVLLIQLNGIFDIASDYLMLIIVIFVLFIGYTFYKIMER